MIIKFNFFVPNSEAPIQYKPEVPHPLVDLLEPGTTNEPKTPLSSATSIFKLNLTKVPNWFIVSQKIWGKIMTVWDTGFEPKTAGSCSQQPVAPTTCILFTF